MTNAYDAFPSLKGKESKLSIDIGQLNSQIKQVEESDRFAENEVERSYQLDELAVKKEALLTEAQEDFSTELQAIEIELAERAFTPPTADSEVLNEARALSTMISTQINTSANVVDTLSLLALRVKSLDDVQKSVLSAELASIKDNALSRVVGPDSRAQAEALINEVTDSVNNTALAKDIAEQQKALNVIKKDRPTIRGNHDMMDLVKRTVRGGK